jgi:hypothetical protein
MDGVPAPAIEPAPSDIWCAKPEAHCPYQLGHESVLTLSSLRHDGLADVIVLDGVYFRHHRHH